MGKGREGGEGREGKGGREGAGDEGRVSVCMCKRDSVCESERECVRE